jgi:glycosyltransferase involved in cell wall biosynthesis
MRRISILLPNLGGGGAERLSVTLAHEFAAAGHEVDFVLMQAEGDLLEEAQSAFRIHDLGCPRARQLLGPLARHLRQHQPDAMIAMMWPLTVIAPVAARLVRYRGKMVVTEQATLSQQYAGMGAAHALALRASTALGYRLATAVTGASQGVCDDVAALSGVPVDRLVTIYNPIPAAVPPSPEDLRRADALWGPGGPRILNVGTLKAQKNQPLLLRAFAALARPDARLMLLGQGDREASLRALAAELGIAERVIFAGFHIDPGPFYANADLFVLSSDYEGFGNVVVEALSHGLPVVSTDCPAGPAEILAGGAFGRLTPVGDAAALTAAIDEALDAPVDRAALIRRAADFAPDIAARQYLATMGL